MEKAKREDRELIKRDYWIVIKPYRKGTDLAGTGLLDHVAYIVDEELKKKIQLLIKKEQRNMELVKQVF